MYGREARFPQILRKKEKLVGAISDSSDLPLTACHAFEITKNDHASKILPCILKFPVLLKSKDR